MRHKFVYNLSDFFSNMYSNIYSCLFRYWVACVKLRAMIGLETIFLQMGQGLTCYATCARPHNCGSGFVQITVN